MTLQAKELKLAQALEKVSKGYAKANPAPEGFALFKIELAKLLKNISPTQHEEKQREEKQKADVSDFLKNAYCKDQHYVNISDAIDLAIYHEATDDSQIGVIIETKTQDNKAEMITADKLNKKSLQQLVYYYLQELITHQNSEIKHLIITNFADWYIFDADEFYRLFAKNKKLVKQFSELTSTTDFFYAQIALPFIDKIDSTIEFTHFNLDDYQNADDEKLIELYKILSPEHLLKISFKNDSNALNKKFYNELLYIIGLTETGKQKKTIERCATTERQSGAILEETITLLKAKDKIRRLPNVAQYGSTEDEQLFNVALELSITWINRILFLKLLEAQLISYHQGDETYAFLTHQAIKSYGNLDDLFFQVLAIKPSARDQEIKEKFAKVPYLNSTLFAPTELEQNTLFVDNLNNKPLPIFAQTVLTDEKRAGAIGSLEYLLKFLDAYDFGSASDSKFQSRDKLINASVLGLIFEKINGYKDGSHFTPGFITEYMCRESIRKAVVQKFNEVKKWKCKDFDALCNKIEIDEIEDLQEANEIVNRLKICDPAVGSGHFLVSALNEMIVIKHDLKILLDRKGKQRLKGYKIEVVDDELQITEQGKPFAYHPKDEESQRVQETLFHEKQTIIEKCLFGVDINPNSVAICRLRLWIELLKNAYYKNPTELETLPNIDINIKCGNSLVSRFPLNADLKHALKGKCTIESYRNAVSSYHSATSKNNTHKMEELIAQIKADFRTSLQLMLPTFSNEKEEEARKIYQNAFEWRFEFPEVLDEVSGAFIGFDVVIGNPPYISHDKITGKQYLERNYTNVWDAFADIYCYFVSNGLSVLKHDGILALITSNSYIKADYGQKLRNFIGRKHTISELLNIEDSQAFDSAIVNTAILLCKNIKPKDADYVKVINNSYTEGTFEQFVKQTKFELPARRFFADKWMLGSDDSLAVLNKIVASGKTLEEHGAKIRLGIATGANDAFLINQAQYAAFVKADKHNKKILKPILRGSGIQRWYYNQSDEYIILAKNGINLPEDYPVLTKHLNSFGAKFKHRGAQGQHWWNLRACNFYDDFKKEKIVWIELADAARFALCTEEIYCINTAYFMIAPDHLNARYLLAILNSPVAKYYVQNFAETSGMGTLRWINNVVSDIPIPNTSPEQQEPVINLVNQILTAKANNPTTNTTALESQIDQLVYELYGLSEEEIKIVEGK